MIEVIQGTVWELPNSDLGSERWFGEDGFRQREKDVPGLEPKACSSF